MSFPTFSPPAAEDYLDVILEQYRESPNLLSLVTFIGEETDALLVANSELYQFYDVDAMGGVNLDILGRIVDVPRGGSSDAEYRPRIKVGLSSSMSGQADEIMREVRSRYGASSVMYIPEYPAGYWLVLDVRVEPAWLADVSPAGVSAHVGSWLAHEDDDPEPYPLFVELEDDGDWILIEDYGTADLEPEPPPPATYTFTSSEEPLVAGAAANIPADALVGIIPAGVVLADALLGIEAVGVALHSANIGESVTILQYGTTGPFGVPPTVGIDMYLGESGRWVAAPPAGAVLSQRTGMSVTLPGGGVGASINIQQPVWL